MPDKDNKILLIPLSRTNPYLRQNRIVFTWGKSNIEDIPSQTMQQNSINTSRFENWFQSFIERVPQLKAESVNEYGRSRAVGSFGASINLYNKAHLQHNGGIV